MSLLSESLRQFLRTAEFLYVATVYDGGKPYVAPKFLISVECDTLFLADFVLGKTWDNLSRQPVLSLAVLNYDTLEGFQLNGTARLLRKGKEYDRLIGLLEQREISLTADRVLASLEANRKSKMVEIAFPKDFGIIRADIGDILTIGCGGKLESRR
ncbi:MAG: pyridoxamine 5'-phosphate oxidase family protein [Deltaproteobacteria bacterium]